MDIDRLIDRFIYSLKLHAASQHTIDSYANDLKTVAEFFKDRQLNNDNIGEFVLWLSKKGYKPSTYNRKLSSFRSFLRFLIKQGLLSFDLNTIKNKKQHRKLPQYIPFDVIKRVMDNKRVGIIVELMYSSGLRVSEIANLRISDIAFDAGFLRIKGKGSKERFVPVSKRTIERLKDYIQNNRSKIKGNGAGDYLFLSGWGRPYTRQGLWKLIKKAFKEEGYDVHPHLLRHMFATHMIENGANIRAVQEMLGHSSITTTQIYTDITDKTVEDAFHKLEILK
ncbi:site-specific tyrosine recombinase/integron integrase [Hippea sp. KM1]|uniref:site-specific tyrosine recombinase/integron integrase n=1 Tax=Hippea sp. KM1 TaxID=944481 RepID=UPI00046CDA42|nr:site-specific tyrosine recombinase/integron integrase [Hippea sp. KM1]